MRTNYEKCLSNIIMHPVNQNFFVEFVRNQVIILKFIQKMRIETENKWSNRVWRSIGTNYGYI